jgi:hypothetical protein
VVIHPERRTSLTAAISAFVIEGCENGRNLLLIIDFFLALINITPQYIAGLY